MRADDTKHQNSPCILSILVTGVPTRRPIHFASPYPHHGLGHFHSVMKHIHHLKSSWLLLAMLVAVVVGETVAWYVTKTLDLRFPAVTVAAICIGLVAAGVSILYDGRE